MIKKIKSRFGLATAQASSPTSKQETRTDITEGTGHVGFSMSSEERTENTSGHLRKPSKKHRVSPQTTTTTPETFSFFKKNNTTDLPLSNSKSVVSSLASLRRLLFLSTSRSSNLCKLQSPGFIQPNNNNTNPLSKDNNPALERLPTNSGEVEQAGGSNNNERVTEASCTNHNYNENPQGTQHNINNFASTFNNYPEKGRSVTNNSHSQLSSATNNFSQSSIYTSPISPLTLKDLNTSREEKRLLRELFFLGPTNINTSASTANPTSSNSSIIHTEIEMSKIDTNMPNRSGSGSNRLELTNRQQKVPEKVKRTFKYKPNLHQEASSNGKSAETNLNLLPIHESIHSKNFVQQFQKFPNNNINHQGESNRTTAMKMFSTTSNQINFRKYPNLAPSTSGGFSSDTRDSATQSAIGINNNNNITSLTKLGQNYNFSSVRKPVESKPFYTILYPNRNQSNQNSGGTLRGLERVVTGVVSQRKMFYQGKIEEKTTSTPTGSPLIRSTTWVKDTISSSAKRNDDKLPKSNSASFYQKNLNSNSGGGKESSKSQHGTKTPKTKTNFPLQHDNSSCSSSGDLNKNTHRGGRDHHHQHVSSDIEYLDDEISDQPDLTLTFKDISPSSSGESLLSSDLMLDHTLRRTSSSNLRGDVEVTSDSAFSDISNANPPSLCSKPGSDRLPPSKNHLKYDSISSPSTPDLGKKKQPNYILRNVQQTSQITPRSSIGRSQTVKSTPLKNQAQVQENLRQTNKSALSTQKSKVGSGCEKSPTRSLKRTDDNSSPTEGKQKEETKESLVKTLVEDISYLKVQLLTLQEELEEKERIDGEKDTLIDRLRSEINLLKTNPVQKNDGLVEFGKRSRHNLELDCQPTRMNAAAQTDSDTISPMRGVSYDDNDKFGELVSFRIGRRISPSATQNAPSDVSLE